MPIRAIGALTPYQLRNVIFAERDDKGRLAPERIESRSAEEVFLSVWERRGVPAWRAKELWMQWMKR